MHPSNPNRIKNRLDLNELPEVKERSTLIEDFNLPTPLRILTPPQIEQQFGYIIKMNKWKIYFPPLDMFGDEYLNDYHNQSVYLFYL